MLQTRFIKNNFLIDFFFEGIMLHALMRAEQLLALREIKLQKERKKKLTAWINKCLF